MGEPPAREEIRRAFADTVRKLRARVGIGQEKLALQAGIDRRYMGALERAVHSPTLETVYKLLPHLNVTAVQFMREFDKALRKPPA